MSKSVFLFMHSIRTASDSEFKIILLHLKLGLGATLPLILSLKRCI